LLANFYHYNLALFLTAEAYVSFRIVIIKATTVSEPAEANHCPLKMSVGQKSFVNTISEGLTNGCFEQEKDVGKPSNQKNG